MAWETCKYCPKKINGFTKLRDHGRQDHKKESARDEAQDGVRHSEEWLQLAQQRLDEYVEYTAFLEDHPILPDHVRILIRRAVDKAEATSPLYGDQQLSVKERLQQYVDMWGKTLSKAMESLKEKEAAVAAS